MVNEAEEWYTGPANELTSAGVGSPLKLESAILTFGRSLQELEWPLSPLRHRHSRRCPRTQLTRTLLDPPTRRTNLPKALQIGRRGVPPLLEDLRASRMARIEEPKASQRIWLGHTRMGNYRSKRYLARGRQIMRPWLTGQSLS